MHDNKRFWNRYSGLYNFEINRFNKAAYEEMYNLMSEVLKADMRVLGVATGTGLIALSGFDSSLKQTKMPVRF
ncbi:MAG: hypothetical protein AAGU75_02040 [Bacillota bacterium]